MIERAVVFIPPPLREACGAKLRPPHRENQIFAELRGVFFCENVFIALNASRLQGRKMGEKFCFGRLGNVTFLASHDVTGFSALLLHNRFKNRFSCENVT